MVFISVGICAFNEEKNIARSLESLQRQQGEAISICDIIVVSSGSMDRTDAIVEDFHKKDPRIQLLRQANREGKNSAVNCFMSSAKGEILVLVNADNTLEPGTLAELVSPFADPSVGMVGGHPLPTNEKDSIPGFAVHMLWDMHHRLSLIYPKAGELVAFRKIPITLPTNMQSDEDIIRMELEKRGYRTVYAPDAIVHNKGPTTVRDFFKQRTRVNIGEQYMKRIYEYEIPTWNVSYLLSAYVGFFRDNKRYLPHMVAAMAMEGLARVYASLYVAMDRGDKAVWSQVASTKDVGKN